MTQNIPLPPLSLAAGRLYLAWLSSCQADVHTFSTRHAQMNGGDPPAVHQILAACPRLLDCEEAAVYFLANGDGRDEGGT